MRNTYLIAAVVVLGLAVPGAFVAGQHVSMGYERNGSTAPGGANSLGLGGGPETTTLPLEEVSLNFLVDSDTTVEYRQYGPGSEMKDCLDWKGDEVYAIHMEDVEFLAYVVPPDWDGMAKVCGEEGGVRFHDPLTTPGQGAEIDDKSSPLLFVALSQGGREDGPETRAADYFLKIDMAEPDEVLVLSAVDDQKPTPGMRIWMNVSLNFEEVQWTYSVVVELPEELLIAKTYDKATPSLYMSIGVHPQILSSGALVEYGLSFAVESEVPAVVWWYDYDCEAA